MDIQPHDDDAYGRVTNPGRYLVVVGKARRLIDQLVTDYEVEAITAETAVEFPSFPGEAREVIRLQPDTGASMVFLFSGFPGVIVRVGDLQEGAFPVCGCDACDEPPKDVARSLEDLVDAVVRGRYSEQVTPRTISYTYETETGLHTSRRLRPGAWRTFGGPGARSWPAWDKRGRSGVIRQEDA